MIADAIVLKDIDMARHIYFVVDQFDNALDLLSNIYVCLAPSQTFHCSSEHIKKLPMWKDLRL